MAQFTLYGPALSTYVRTVRMVLEETNTAYEMKGIDIFSGDQNAPEYLAKHPFGKVPTLQMDGELLYETCAIVEYLDALLNDRGFTPPDLLLQARMRQIMAIVDSYLYAPAIGTITIQRIVVPGQGGEPDEEAVKAAAPSVKTALEAIEAIAPCTPYLLGNDITLADFYVMPVMFYLSKTPEFDGVTVQTPKLKTWWDEARQHPSLVKVTS